MPKGPLGRGLSLGILTMLLTSVQAGNDDWQPLFNGRDLSGWQGVAGPLKNWKAEDGKLVCTGEKGAKWIATTEQYDDFELSLEVKLSPNANSGVFLRCPLTRRRPAYQGMEIQLLDQRGEKYQKRDLRETQLMGALYDVVAPSKNVTKKANQWQKLVIRCAGRHCTIRLNGTTIVQADLDKLAEKRQKHTGLKRRKGYIGLQNHGDRLEFRNIRIRPVPPSAS